MFGIADEWWILYLLILGASSYIVGNIRRAESGSKQSENEERLRKFHETTTDQLTTIDGAMPDISPIIESLEEVVDLLRKIERNLSKEAAGRRFLIKR